MNELLREKLELELLEDIMAVEKKKINGKEYVYNTIKVLFTKEEESLYKWFKSQTKSMSEGKYIKKLIKDLKEQK